MVDKNKGEVNDGILFFILLFLMLFYDNRSIGILGKKHKDNFNNSNDCSLLFFILIFLILFY